MQEKLRSEGKTPAVVVKAAAIITVIVMSVEPTSSPCISQSVNLHLTFANKSQRANRYKENVTRHHFKPKTLVLSAAKGKIKSTKYLIYT